MDTFEVVFSPTRQVVAMKFLTTCTSCGKLACLIGMQIFSGWHAMNCCKDGMAFVPETPLTKFLDSPLNTSAVEIIIGED